MRSFSALEECLQRPQTALAVCPDVQFRAQFRILLLRCVAQEDGLLCDSKEPVRVGPA